MNQIVRKLILIGSFCHFTFKSVRANSGNVLQYLNVVEGNYLNRKFNVLLNRNGDETDWGGPMSGAVSAVLRNTLILRYLSGIVFK